MSHLRLLAISASLAWSLMTSLTLSAAEEHSHAHAHGKPVALGKASIGTAACAVTGAGEVVPGQEWHVGVVLPPDAPAPKTIRVWVGTESGRGSEKARALKTTGGSYEAHVAVPNPLAAGSAVWIAVESAAGQTEKGSVSLPGAATPKPHSHDGHDHAGHKHD